MARLVVSARLPFLFFVLGLLLWPLAVVHASPSADHMPFCGVRDDEPERRDHPRPAGKRLADLNRGAPRTVRMIYFLPKDRPFRQDVVDLLQMRMREVQTFYAEQMQAHGYGNTTFRVETDARGEPLVHRVDGNHPERHYNTNHTIGEVLDEIYFGEGPLQFDVVANDYLIVIDNSTGSINSDGSYVGGINFDIDKRGGVSLVPSDLGFNIIAHELGHTFGLGHDFRDDLYLMSYGGGGRDRLSACAAASLSVHPYFNAAISLGDERSLTKAGVSWSSSSYNPPTVELISSPTYPAGATKVSVRVQVSDADGIHQVILRDITRRPHRQAGLLSLAACRGLDGAQDAVVEFEYDVSIPPFFPEQHRLYVWVVDADGEVDGASFSLSQSSSYHVATLAHPGEVRSLSFSPAGRLLATSARETATVSLWDVASRQQVETLELEHWSPALSFSPAGGLLAMAVSGSVQLWDVESRRRVATLAHPGWVRSLSFSPAGGLLATLFSGSVQLWDVESRRRVATFPLGDYADLLSFSPDGRWLAVHAGDGIHRIVTVLDLASGQPVERFFMPSDHYVYALLFSPKSTWLAITGTGSQLLDLASGQRVTLAHPGDGSVRSLSFSPDGRSLAMGGDNGAIWLWDVASRQRVATLVHAGIGTVRVLSFSPDGRLLASGGEGGREVWLWDVSEWIGEQTITTVEQRPHTLTKVSGQGQQGTVSQPLTKPFVVSVKDQNGSALAGAVVTFSVTAGGGTLSSSTATTNANGRARSTLTLGSQPGANTVAATVAGLQPVTFTATATDQTPHSLTKVSGEGQAGPASTQLAAPLVVSVLDQEGAELAGVDVTFAVTAGGGVLSSAADANPCIFKSSKSSITATTDANGQATTRLTLGSQPGTNTVEVTVAGLAPVAFTATAAEQAAPYRLTKVCGEDQEGIVGALLAESLVVSVVDEDGAALAGVDVSFAVTAGGGTLSATTVATNANGRAATRLTLGSEAGPNTVEATVEGLESVTFTATGEKSALASMFDAFGSGKRVALPDSPQLAQNAPNPFNSQTVISYFLHAPSPARVEVFALSGQRVAVLQQGLQQAGYHRLHWDGRDEAGRPVASGLYLYRLVTAEAVLTRKLLLLR